jgi:hypothetical protein
MAQTPTAELIGIKLGVDLPAWIEGRRADGWSFARMAAEVYRETDIYVTSESLRRWTRPGRRSA